QFYDSDLEVAFRRNACFVRNLKGVDLLKGDHLTNLYTINLHEMPSASPICLMARASSAKKPNISFLHVFGALCYPKNDREDIGKLGAKGAIGFFIGYSANSCDYRVYNRRTKKIMETMNVSFDELYVMAFKQSSSKPGLNTTARTISPAQEPQVHVDELNPNAMLDGNTFVNPFANPSTSAVVASSSSQNVDPSNMHTFYQPCPYEFQWTKDHPLEIGEPSRPVLTRNQLRSDGDICMYALTTMNVTFVELSAMAFKQRSLKPGLQSMTSGQINLGLNLTYAPSTITRNQLRSDGDMCMYALSVSTMKPKNVKEAMTDPAWIDSMQEELLQFKRLDVWVLVPVPDNISPLTLKWLFKFKHDEE
nr:putative ribonuclease H-like domain-containing protein [Tanacetum cinerariifolium]